MSNKAIKIEWRCPKCGADANQHGKGGKEKCQERHSGHESCNGFLCECDGDTGDHHGESFADPCIEARCHHCGWAGTFPEKPKGLQAWEKKALDAGWTPPEARQKELGL